MFDYDQFFRQNPVSVHDQPERHALVASLCSGHVLDIGCGTGSLADYYQGEYTGYDVSEVAIKKAREHRRRDAHFYNGDFTALRHFDFSEFDTIVMAEFLEHIDSDENIFEAIRESLKHGAKIIISVPNFDRVPSPDHVRQFTVAELRSRFADLGKITFKNWPGERERIIMVIEHKVPARRLISLAIIAKNEAKGIEHALLSALESVDDMVVLIDSSTTDETQKIARRYTGNVFIYEWHDDFSDARNQALSKVTTPWAMFLDGHEYLNEPVDLDYLQYTAKEGIMIQIRLENGVIVRYPRIHLARLRYEDKVHNRLISDKIGVDKKVLFVHDREHGQSAESTKAREAQRHDMLMRIMGDQLKKDPRNTRALMHIGLHFHARKNYRRAIKYYKRYLKYSQDPGERWFVRFNLTMCEFACRHKWRAEYQTTLLERESPGRWETSFITGIIYLEEKRYSEAAAKFINSLDIKEQEAMYKPIQRDPSVIWNHIGESFFNLKQYEQAGTAFHRAASFCKIPPFKNLLQKRGDLMDKMAVACRP